MAEEKKVSPQEFYETWPLYRRLQLYDGWETPDRISRECQRCGKETTWKQVTHTSAGLYGYVHIDEFKCGLCESDTVYFLTYTLRSADGALYIQKVGQFPPHSINIPASIERRLGSSADLYRKGLVCRNQGYGVGALAYFRRVIEDKTNELIDIVADWAEARGIDNATVTKIRAAKAETT